MSFTGFSVFQAQQLDGQDGRLTSVESLAASKVAQTTYNTKLSQVDSALLTHTNEISALNLAVAQRVLTSTYDDKMAAVDAKDAAQDGRLTAVESLAASKVDQSVYLTKMGLLDAKDAAHEGRLDAVEGVAASKVAQTAYDTKVADLEAADAALSGRVGAIESDITGRVQAAIDEKVAQTVFDSLASELRNADSALTTALATKVAAETQSAVDAAQNDIIAQKASINQLNNLVNNVNAALSSIDQAKVEKGEFYAKRDAIEEFIAIFLQTYTITKPNGQPYAYTGVKQNLLVPQYVAASPTNVTYNSTSKVLSFSLPAQSALDLNFVDINIQGQWFHFVNPAYNQPNASTYSRNGSEIFIDLTSVAVSGLVRIFTRYDSVSQSSDAGYAEITV
jgi:hypothetical protein